MLFDRVTISVRAGNGGNGCVSFRHEKFTRFGGPDGGNGGAGGSVYLRAQAGLNTLINLVKRRRFEAEDGGHGQGKGQHGRTGSDLYIDVPLGTVVKDKETGVVLGDLLAAGQTLLVAHGGRSGRGNQVFKTSTRQTPRFAERGQPGQQRMLALELKLIAQVGLLGKPNVGKSTLLAAVSRARPKIAEYAFTTLSPSLGVAEVGERVFVVADIPGLIEGAHSGAGLGLQFLRHVQRTRLLLHVLDGCSPDPVADYDAINNELRMYDPQLADRPQIVVLNKIDIPAVRERLGSLVEALAAKAGQAYAISALTGEGIPELMRATADCLGRLPEEATPPNLHVFRPAARESTAFAVVQQGPGRYQVTGEEIERLAIMTDWSSNEAMERFERMLRARGISERLEEAGVQDGDTVLIGEIELEWR